MFQVFQEYLSSSLKKNYNLLYRFKFIKLAIDPVWLLLYDFK